MTKAAQAARPIVMNNKTRFDDAHQLRQFLSGCFNALVKPAFDNPALKGVVGNTLIENGIAAAMPVRDVLNALEPVHTGLVVEEARLMIQSAEQMQARQPLLLRSSRAIYGITPQDEVGYARIVQRVAGEIAHAHGRYVPYAYNTAGNFLTAAKSYPSASRLRGAIDGVQARYNGVAQEFGKLMQGMNASPLTPAQLDAFYAGYTDMTADPAADYQANTNALADTHITIAETSLARMGLRITQAYLCLNDAESVQAIRTDAVLAQDFETKLRETGATLRRVDIHLQGGVLDSGAIHGAVHYLPKM